MQAGESLTNFYLGQHSVRFIY